MYSSFYELYNDNPNIKILCRLQEISTLRVFRDSFGIIQSLPFLYAEYGGGM